MKSLLFTYKKIILGLFSFAVFCTFMGMTQNLNTSNKITSFMNQDKCQENLESLSPEENSILFTLNHNLNHNLPGSHRAVIDENNSLIIKNSLWQFGSLTGLNLEETDYDFIQLRNFNFIKNNLPKIQTEKALRSDILLI